MKNIPFNPYIVGNPIKSQQMFFGREDDFQFVQKKIGEGRSNQIVVLCGERRSGKTSILFQILGGRLGDAFLPVLIDMQMLAGVADDREFFRAILRAAAASPSLSGLALESVSANGAPADQVGAFLSEVERRLPGKIVLFLFDEYELIEAKIRDGTLDESAIHAFAGILESPHRVSFIFTGSTNLEDRKVDVWKSLLGKSIYRKISYLSRRDTLRLIVEPLKDAVTWPDEVAETVYRLTGGQPFYTQVICQNIVDLLIEEGRGNPAAEDLERILREIVDNPLPQMIYSWNAIVEGEQVVLAALAGRLEEQEQWADAADVLAFLGAHRILLPFPRERVNVFLETGYHGEFLEKQEAGAYRFKMDLFRRWIRREHSIWKVAREAGLAFRKRARPVFITGLVAAAVVVLAAAAWFLPGPRFLVEARSSLVSRLAPGRDRATPPVPSSPRALEKIAFKANRGPFRLAIDGEQQLTTEGLTDLKTIIVASMDPGRHRIVATPVPGSPITMDIEVTASGQTIALTFAAAPFRTAEAPAAGGTEAAAAAAMTEQPAPAATPVTTDTPAVTVPAATQPQPEQEKLGLLVVNSRPTEARVYIDDKDTGHSTPYAEGMAPGNYTLRLELPGYHTKTKTFTLTEKKLQLDIVMEEAFAELTFDVRPTAKIYLDGTFLVETPYAKPVKIRSGPHTLRIENETLKVNREIPIDLAEGETKLVQEVLKEVTP